MKKPSPWVLLRAEKVKQQQGLRQIQKWHVRERSGSTIMELGIAYLWLQQYQQAFEHFREAIRECPQKGDCFYGMAGVAKWCDNKPSEAVSEWQEGLRAKYARANGLGVRMPLLLFFASVIYPDIAKESYVKKILLEKSKDPRIATWPAPIAKFVLGQINEIEFQKYWQCANPEDARNRWWLTEFYKIILKCKKRNRAIFKKRTHELAEINEAECRSEDILLTRIWNEEYFLIRHEGKLN